MKLELKHIAGYLSWGIKVKSNISDRIYNVLGVKLYNLELIVCRYTNATIFLNETKLILRPMSDLTKEIEHNGEKIIPLIELGKLTYLKDNFFLKTNCGINGYSSESKYSFEFFNGNFYMKMLKGKRWVDHPVYQQTALFNLLDELHFDYKYDLIKNGLAIDINTLKS